MLLHSILKTPSRTAVNIFKGLIRDKTFRSAVFTSPLAIIRLGTGFIRSKYAAISLLPAGVGLLSQANLFVTFFTAIGSLGLVNSLMQQMSYHRERNNVTELLKVKGTTLVSQLAVLAVLVLPLVFFTGPLNRYLFNTRDTSYHLDMLFLLAGIPVTVITSNYVEGFFTAYSRFNLYVRASSWAAIVSLLLFFPLVELWGIHGAIIHVWANVFVLLLFFLYYVKKIVDYKEVFIFRFDAAVFKRIFREGVVNLSCAALASLVALLIRNSIIHRDGESENGIYQIVISVTAYYTPFITNPIWANYFPLLSAKGVTDETQRIIKSTLVYTMLACSAVCAVVLTIPELLIRILASPEFLRAKQYFSLQMAGDIWYFIFFIFGIYLLSQRKVKQYLVMWICYLVVQYIVAQLLIIRLGVNGAPIAYSISCLCVGIYAITEFGKLLPRSDFSKILELLALCVVFVTGLAACCWYDIPVVIKAAGLVAWGISVLALFKFVNIKKILQR